MPTLRIFDAWECHDIAGNSHRGGSRSAPIELSVDGYVDHDIISLATATTLTLWDSAEAITDFDFFWLIADQDLRIEVTADRGNDVGDEVLAFIVTANTPLRLIYDDALALYTANFAAGTADVIDRIRARNESGRTASIERAIIT